MYQLPEIHVHTFRKNLGFIWGCAFPVSLNMILPNAQSISMGSFVVKIWYFNQLDFDLGYKIGVMNKKILHDGVFPGVTFFLQKSVSDQDPAVQSTKVSGKLGVNFDWYMERFNRTLHIGLSLT